MLFALYFSLILLILIQRLFFDVCLLIRLQLFKTLHSCCLTLKTFIWWQPLQIVIQRYFRNVFLQLHICIRTFIFNIWISIFSKNFLIKYVDCTLILLNSLINIIHDRGRGVWSIEHENWFWLWASYIHFSCTLHHWASLLVFLTMDILYIFKWSNFVVYLRIFTF